jgi:SAM-dependent methyltransferase
MMLPSLLPPSVDEAAYDQLIEVGFSFWKSQILFAALQLDVFTVLDDAVLTPDDLARRAGLEGRGSREFIEALVALGLLERIDGRVRSSATAAGCLNRRSPTYIGGLFEFSAERLYPVWQQLGVALQSGRPQNEAHFADDYYANLCADRERHARFLSGMDGLSGRAASVLAAVFPWQRYRSFADIGGGRGTLAATIAAAHPHLTGINLDLPAVEPFFHELARERQLQDRLTFVGADFFRDPLPPVDVAVMGHVFHNWNVDEKRELARRVRRSLSDDGALIVYEWFLDREQSASLPGMLMSLNMLLVTHGGCGSTTAACAAYLREAGFARTEARHVAGPCSMVIGWCAR